MRAAFVLGEIAQNMRRNLSMILSVILVTFISLTFVGAAALMQLQINHMKSFWYDRAQVAVFMCTNNGSPKASCGTGEASAEQINNVKARLEAKVLEPFVEKYYFENHEQAYENFKKQFRNNKIVELTTPDQINETFWIKLKDPAKAAVIIEAFSGMSGVDEVIDQKKYLDQIFSVLNIASLTAISIASLMLIAAVLLIATTIRLSAFSRRRELGIMRLVGASNLFVQAPFVLEGVIAASIGAALASGTLLAITKFFVTDFLAHSLPLVSFFSVSDALIIVPGIFAVGIILAALSAKFSISRSLRV